MTKNRNATKKQPSSNNDLSVFVSLPFDKAFNDVSEAIKEVVSSVATSRGKQAVISHAANLTGDPDPSEQVRSFINDVDLLIADTTLNKPNVFFELGIAESASIPTIVIHQVGSPIPFDIANTRIVLMYEREQLKLGLVPQLTQAVQQALFLPDDTKAPLRQQPAQKPSLFVSYSHADQAQLNRMMVHLKPLERQALVEVWSDTKIKAGAKWQEQIERAIERSAIAVLLISADFLASEFIIDNELPRILGTAKEEGKRILQVVLKPCRFLREQSLSSFQAVNEPTRPLLTLPDIEQEAVWDELALAIENEVKNRLI